MLVKSSDIGHRGSGDGWQQKELARKHALIRVYSASLNYSYYDTLFAFTSILCCV